MLDLPREINYSEESLKLLLISYVDLNPIDSNIYGHMYRTVSLFLSGFSNHVTKY